MIPPSHDMQPRSLAKLAYLFLTLVFGGASAAGYTANLLLQVSGALLAGWSLRGRGREHQRPFRIAFKREGLPIHTFQRGVWNPLAFTHHLQLPHIVPQWPAIFGQRFSAPPHSL